MLGVGNDAGADEIRRAFRARALVTHPDRGGDRAAFAELLEAFESLGAAATKRDTTRPATTKPEPTLREWINARRLPEPVPLARIPFDAYDSPRRPAPRR